MSHSTHARRILPILALGLVASLSPAGAEKGAAWKPFISDGVYQELKSRSARAIEQDSKRKEVEGYLLQGYELAAGKKTGADVKLPASQDLGEMMNLLRNKTKGGEGTAPELQYNGKLKKQDGIESLIGALASKQLTDDNVGKTSKELELLAYRVAVVGAITHDNPPTEKKDGLPGWRKLSLEMRDSAVSLAEAASKKNASGIQTASTRLENTCTQCHRDFRK